jgi:hypothetical protein
MKLPEYALSTSDRVSTREELFEVLELLGGFDEPHGSELAESGDLLPCLETDLTASPSGIFEELRTTEVLMELEPFESLLGRKSERIN